MKELSSVSSNINEFLSSRSAITRPTNESWNQDWNYEKATHVKHSGLI